jgi:hypothetical protein
MLSGTLTENPGSALLYGEPGCGKSTLALKFGWQTQGAFDAVVFQLCGQRSVAEIAAEMARKLKLGLGTRPAEEQTAAAKAWLAERRALLVLDDAPIGGCLVQRKPDNRAPRGDVTQSDQSACLSIP